MAKRTTTVSSIVTRRIAESKLNPKVVDLFLTKETILIAMLESVEGVKRINTTNKFTVEFVDGTDMEFVVERDEEGVEWGAITRFDGEYVRKIDVPEEYRHPVIVDATTLPVEVKKAIEKPDATKPEITARKQAPKAEDVLNSISDKELEAFLAARKSKSKDSKPAKEHTTDDNETDSGGEPETEEQSGLNNDEAAPDDDSKYDETDEEDGYDETDEEDGYDETEEKRYEDELFEHKGGKFPK